MQRSNDQPVEEEEECPIKTKKHSHMQRSNDQPVEEEEECPICLDSLPKDPTKYAHTSCCGKGIHIKCRDGVLASSMSFEQKNQCVMCRTRYPGSEKELIEQLRPWVEKGKAWAQFMLGNKYDNGIGVEQSNQQARELYELAASQGYAHAQYNLGVMYRDGQGVDQNYERAAEYFEAATRQGMTIAQYNLGVMYRDGQGVDQSYERAAENWEAAARQGYANAQSNLGLLYAQGLGVEQSNETARQLWMKAAEQGVEGVIENLQILDKKEGRTTPKRCSLCDTPETPTHKIHDCPCFGAQYCNAKCQTSQWKLHKKEHRRLCKEMNLKNTQGEMKDEVV